MSGEASRGSHVPAEAYVPSDPKHPQVALSVDGPTVDEKIAPLVVYANNHGLKTRTSCQGGGEGVWALAYITFPDYLEAVEFLAQTMHNLDYHYDDQIALTISRPLALEEGPNGKVTWHPVMTDRIIDSWRMRL